MAVVGIRVTNAEGESTVYDEARQVTRDGYGDVELRDAKGDIVALLPRSEAPKVERVSE